MPLSKVYLGGALSNPEVVRLTKLLMRAGYTVFSDWYSPGPDADVNWRTYEKDLGYSYRESLTRPSAQHIFNFDRKHIDASDVFVAVYPCGKSAHMELGYAVGSGKRGVVYMPKEPDRYDLMLAFADSIVYGDAELLSALAGEDGPWDIKEAPYAER